MNENKTMLNATASDMVGNTGRQLLDAEMYTNLGFYPAEFNETAIREERRKKKERKKRYDAGYRGILMRLLLTVGVVSYRGLHLLPGDRTMYLRKLKDMEQEHIVELLRKDGKRSAMVARINKFDEMYKKYISELPLGYYGHYNRYAKPNQYKVVSAEKKGTTAERVIRDSEIVEMMYGAGIQTLPEDIVNLLSDAKIPSTSSCYYNISQLKAYNTFPLRIKEADKEEEHTMTSRVLGLLISPGGAYTVYHTGKSAMFWKNSSEDQMSYHLSLLIGQKCEDAKLQGKLQDCIIVGNDMGVFKKIYEGEKARCVNINNGYAKTYAIPYDKQGQKMLQRMTKANWQRDLNRAILTEYSVIDNINGISCDGIKEDRIALNFCNGNLTRLQRFLNSLAWNYSAIPKEHEVYCYPFQKSFVESLAGSTVKIIVAENTKEEV